MLRSWSSRGMGTPEVKIPWVPGPALTSNKIASSNFAGQQLPAGQNPLKFREIAEPEENQQ